MGNRGNIDMPYYVSDTPMTRRLHLGRHLCGLAAIAFGIISLVWHDFAAPWQQIRVLGSVPHREILVYIAAALELFGGLAIQWRRTARWGALALGAIFFIWALMSGANVVAEPRELPGSRVPHPSRSFARGWGL